MGGLPIVGSILEKVYILFLIILFVTGLNARFRKKADKKQGKTQHSQITPVLDTEDLEGDPECDVSVIILGKNNPDRIKELIQHINRIVPQCGLTHEIIFVDCCSVNDTVEQMTQVKDVVVCRCPTRCTISTAMMIGFKKARGQIISVHLMGASTRFDYFPSFLEKITDLSEPILLFGEYDMDYPPEGLKGTVFFNCCQFITKMAWKSIGVDGGLICRCPVYLMTRPLMSELKNRLHKERRSPEIELMAISGALGVKIESVKLDYENTRRLGMDPDFILHETLEVLTVALLFVLKIYKG